MANAGAGLPVGGATKAAYYPASSTQGLIDAFNTIIKGVRNCQLKLNGAVDASGASTGTVSLNGTSLGFGDPNGWKLLDPSTIELEGTACMTFQSADNIDLSASFGCNTVTIF
jgi:hypothetical protein